MTYKWYFAPLNGGQESGLNDSGVSYFESDPIRSVAKETLQDSIDALHEGESKTIVKFNLFHVTKEEVPDYGGLYQSFKNGKKRWSHHQDTKLFFENGLNMLDNSKIPVLAIQDYQTTGLSKVGNSKTGGWYTLISATGVTEKGATEGGSYGIGKNAPFAASALRTVLYSTKNRQNEIGFQGISKIPTTSLADGKTTQGTGYFYNIKERRPITKKSNVLKSYQREEYGTDKFILGFNDEIDWENRIMDEIICSYLLAIYRERLEVHVNDFIIKKETLPQAIEKIRDYTKDSLALQYYEVMNSSFTKSFEKNLKQRLEQKRQFVCSCLLKTDLKNELDFIEVLE